MTNYTRYSLIMKFQIFKSFSNRIRRYTMGTNSIPKSKKLNRGFNRRIVRFITKYFSKIIRSFSIWMITCTSITINIISEINELIGSVMSQYSTISYHSSNASHSISTTTETKKPYVITRSILRNYVFVSLFDLFIKTYSHSSVYDKTREGFPNSHSLYVLNMLFALFL